MNGTFLFVVNPISGGTDKKSLISKIRSWSEKNDVKVSLWETTGRDDKSKLRAEIEKLCPETVVAVGGDGTLVLCAEVLRDTGIKLGLIPGGSANGMASELNIPTNVDEALEIIEKGRTTRADMILFNGEKPGLHISDIGLNAKLVRHFEESGRRGFLGYAGGVITELFQLENFQVEIRTEREKIRESCYMVAFANAKRYGTGALLNKMGKIDDGLMEICILKEFDLAGIAGQFWDMIDDDSDYLEVIQCREATIRTEEEVCFQIDGELQISTREVHVEVLPSCLEIIIPRPPQKTS